MFTGERDLAGVFMVAPLITPMRMTHKGVHGTLYSHCGLVYYRRGFLYDCRGLFYDCRDPLYACRELLYGHYGTLYDYCGRVIARYGNLFDTRGILYSRNAGQTVVVMPVAHAAAALDLGKFAAEAARGVCGRRDPTSDH